MRLFVKPEPPGPSALKTSYLRWGESGTTPFLLQLTYDCVYAERRWHPPLSVALKIWRLDAKVSFWAPWFNRLHISDRQSPANFVWGVCVVSTGDIMYPYRLIAQCGWHTLNVKIGLDRYRKSAPYHKASVMGKRDS
jgi:hypothetical protein